MGENTLALLRFLSSEESPLPNLTSGYTPPTTIYLTLAGKFFMYSFATAKMMYCGFFFASLLYVRLSASKDKEGAGVAIGVMAVITGVLGTILVPNVVAFIMNKLLNKGMSWFSSPFAPLVLYGPPSILGVLISQYLIGPVSEQAIFNAMLLLQSGLALAIQMAGVGSASVFFLSGLPMLVALLINPLITGSAKTISLVAYALAQVEPLLVGTLILATVAEVFVPLVRFCHAYGSCTFLTLLTFRLAVSERRHLRTILLQASSLYWALRYSQHSCPLFIGSNVGNFGMVLFFQVSRPQLSWLCSLRDDHLMRCTRRDYS
jgi:hypothetical protein